jgi:hypothetical protein
MKLIEYHHRSAPGVVLRAYSPLGFYPSAGFRHSDGCFFVDESLILSAVRFNPVKLAGYDPEREWISPAEIRLLASISLAIPEGSGVVYPYPDPVGYRIEDAGPEDITGEDFMIQARECLCRELRGRNSGFWTTVPVPPVFGGPPYEFNTVAWPHSEQNDFFTAIDVEDHLLIRGLGGLLKGWMLNRHHLFHTEACISLHIAMEASRDIVLRHLRASVSNPSDIDAANYLARAFGEPESTEHYFAGFYADRIKSVHPASRYGTYPEPPLAADDFFDLYHWLCVVYRFLIAGKVPSESF